MKKLIFSNDTKYRYVHSSSWDSSKLSIMFITLFPKASEKFYLDDDEVLKGVALAKEWGYGSVRFCSLFAYYAQEQERVFLSGHPVGIDNDEHILRCMLSSAKIVCVWGDDGVRMKRAKKVTKMIGHHKKLFCLGRTKLGNPKQLHEFDLTTPEPSEVL